MTKCSPGSNPHDDRRNWRPAETFEEYLSNCREGLEEFSEARAARLLGVPRVELWRWKLMAELPEELFELLLAADKRPSTKALANAAKAIREGRVKTEVQCCPHCGGVIRRRASVKGALRKVVDKRLDDGGAQ